MFEYHYDHQNEQWNVFRAVGAHKEYIISFKNVEEAIAYCQKANYPNNASALFASATREVNHA